MESTTFLLKTYLLLRTSGKMSSREIADHFGVTTAYVRKYLSIGAKNGLIKSAYGGRGGYWLDEPVSVAQILMVHGKLKTPPDDGVYTILMSQVAASLDLLFI